MMFCAIMNILPTITMYFTTIDGPLFWYSRGQINQFVDSLVFIINRNNKKEVYEKDGAKNTTVASLTNELGLEEFDLTEKNVILTFTNHNLPASEFKVVSKDKMIDKNPKSQPQETTEVKIGWALLFSKEYRMMVVSFAAISIAEFQVGAATILGAASIGLSNTNLNIIMMSSVQILICILSVFTIHKISRVKALQ